MSEAHVRPDEVFSREALWCAAKRATRDKGRRPSVGWFRLALEDHLIELRDALLGDVWRPSRPVQMRVRDPKPRTISVLPLRDRVVHQCLFPTLDARIARRLITDCYASRAGLGTHAALTRATAWARTFRWWVRLDVRQFFPSVDHAIVREQLARDVPEAWLRAFCERILAAGEGPSLRAHFPGDDLFAPSRRAVGLPLGSLTSQLWANRFLDPVDHLVKDRLRLRGYLRYMDDMLLFHDDRDALVDVARRVEAACAELRLRLHPWQVQPTSAGVGFVGYRITPHQVRMRRSGVARAERRLGALAEGVRDGAVPFARYAASLRATFGHWSHADAWRLRERTLRRIGMLDRDGKEVGVPVAPCDGADSSGTSA
ncbi:MAG: RNA-directed DNA polymerase [Polyangiales bacterium]